MKTKKLFYETSTLFSVLTVLIVLGIIAIVSQVFLHKRLDLTEGKQFTLSSAAVKTLETLPDLVTIKAAISSDLPSQFVQIKTHVKDLLLEFKARAKGKMELTFIDPGDNEEKKKQVTGLGIQEVQLQEQTSKGMEIKRGFFGLAITYGDKKETIPVLNNIESFEYDLIVKIKKLTGTAKTVGIVEGGQGAKATLQIPGEQAQVLEGFDAMYPSLKNQMEKLYHIEKVDLATKDISDSVDLLFVAAPARLDETEKFRLDQFLMKGKGILFLSPGVHVSFQMGIMGNASTNGYEDLLDHYGLPIKKNIVTEGQFFELAPFGNSIFPIPYPYWVVVTGDGLNKENTITSKVGRLSFPWTSSINLDSAAAGNPGIEKLAVTSESAWEEVGRFNLYPRDLKEFLPVDQRPHVLAAIKTGSFHSFFKGKSLADSALGDADRVDSTSEGRLLVVANSLFATDFYMRLIQSPNNMNFVLNAIDQLVLDPDLIKVRSRSISTRPIPEDKAKNKTAYVMTNMLIAPILLLAIGIFIGIRRRKRDAI